MSLYGSMTTAISGLNAQARALGNVADNVANSQTTGYKRVDTSFTDYVTSSSLLMHQSGAVVARPDYTNAVQGNIAQTENPLAMAISGQGFFAVSQSNGTNGDGLPTFDGRTFYTRAGDFSMDRDGYLVNNQGYFLDGWSVDAADQVNRTAVAPLRIDQSVFDPVATSQVVLGANLPADAAGPVAGPPAIPGASVGSQIQVYDALGREHPVQLNYTKLGDGVWQLDVLAPDSAGAPTTPIGTAELRFGAAAGTTPATPPGTLGTMTYGAGALGGPPGGVAGAAANPVLNVDFGPGAQAVTLDFGNFGTSQGLTQFAGNQFTVRSLSQNGAPLGSFSSVSISENGNVVVNYDNGRTRAVGRVPVAAFSDPDKLQRVDGQAFLRTVESGEARLSDANNNGSGKLVAGALENSNVDIASEFSKLILAQRAYTANTKIITASDEMLQDTLNMRR